MVYLPQQIRHCNVTLTYCGLLTMYIFATKRRNNDLKVSPCNISSAFRISQTTLPSLLPIFQVIYVKWCQWECESIFFKLAFPTQVYQPWQLRFDYESPESATLLLTVCSLNRVIKAFVFPHHPTVPPASARKCSALWKQRGGVIYYSN